MQTTPSYGRVAYQRHLQIDLWITTMHGIVKRGTAKRAIGRRHACGLMYTIHGHEAARTSTSNVIAVALSITGHTMDT